MLNAGMCRLPAACLPSAWRLCNARAFVASCFYASGLPGLPLYHFPQPAQGFWVESKLRIVNSVNFHVPQLNLRGLRAQPALV
jgi:hypothetical protein